MPDTSLLAFFGALLVIGLFIDAMIPQEHGRRWDSSKPATQRDLAEVIAGRKERSSEPRLLPLVVLLVIVYAAIYLVGQW